jgi:hypothetical protein
MLRSVLSVIALAGVLAAAQPAFADPAAATAPDQIQAAASPTEQPASPPPARASSPDAPASAGVAKNITFVGFGWG